jgi:hypothetical protein
MAEMAARRRPASRVIWSGSAHDSRIQTDKAYQRSDLPAKRREIMQGWSDFVVSTS